MLLVDKLYIDILIDGADEKYQLLCEHLDGPDAIGMFKIAGVESWIFPLEKA